MTIKLKNVGISNCKVGIKLEGPERVEAEDVNFDNVETPWDVSGVRSADVRGTRIKE